MTTFPPRRTIDDRPLHTRADHQHLDRHRQYATAYRQLVDGSSAYPDPAQTFERGLPYSLTLPELRAEWSRRHDDEGWQRWELDERLHPSPLALAGVAA